MALTTLERKRKNRLFWSWITIKLLKTTQEIKDLPEEELRSYRNEFNRLFKAKKITFIPKHNKKWMTYWSTPVLFSAFLYVKYGISVKPNQTMKFKDDKGKLKHFYDSYTKDILLKYEKHYNCRKREHKGTLSVLENKMRKEMIEKLTNPKPIDYKKIFAIKRNHKRKKEMIAAQLKDAYPELSNPDLQLDDLIRPSTSSLNISSSYSIDAIVDENKSDNYSTAFLPHSNPFDDFDRHCQQILDNLGVNHPDYDHILIDLCVQRRDIELKHEKQISRRKKPRNSNKNLTHKWKINK